MIIIGRYDDAHRTALVRKIEGPSRDSVSGPSMFQRGICGIDTLLTQLWLRKVYYLGEWHFHPEPYPKASWIDELQIAELARTTKLRCPEPLLLIVGLPDRGGHIAAYVFRDRLVELPRISAHPLGKIAPLVDSPGKSSAHSQEFERDNAI